MVLGEGSRKLLWPKTVIQKIQATLKPGTKLFNRHNADNSTSGRSGVGDVVTSFTKDVGGKLRTIAVACMTKANAALYDVCSIEAEVNEDNGTVWDVSKITGIAVSNSSIDQPAFTSAKRMQIVQCFDEPQRKPGESSKDKNMPVTLEDLQSVPIAMLKQATQMRNMHPSQLFDLKDMENDREFGSIVKDKTAAEQRVTTLEADLKKNKDEFDTVQKKTVTQDAKALFDTKLAEKVTEKKISAKQSLFLSENFDATTFDTADEAAIEGYFTKGTEDYQRVAKIFGGNTDVTGGNNQGSDEPTDKSIDDAFIED